jgi:hypothetical protein
MSKLTLPNANVPLGKCPHCGAEILINQTWFQKLKAILDGLNGLLP